MKTIKFFNHHLDILPLLIVLSTLTILVKLGFWQLHRLKEKQIFIDTITSNLQLEDKEGVEFLVPYDKIKIHGHYLSDKDIFLYGQRFMTNKNQGGYYLLTPFATDDGNVYLVARNWFSQEARAEVEHLQNSEAKLDLTAIALKSEYKKSFMPDNDGAKNMWFTLDLNEISEFTNININKDIYLVDANSQDSNFLKAIDLNAMTRAPNNHLEYALTWFSLAIILLAIYVVSQCKNAYA